jgi:hypothetical protein
LLVCYISHSGEFDVKLGNVSKINETKPINVLDHITMMVRLENEP